MQIVFVCHGNICRSPMAEFVMKNILAENRCANHRIWSRAAQEDALGCDMYAPARRVLAAHGVPFVRHTATLIDRRDFDEADIVAVMDEENVADLTRVFGRSDKVRKLMSFAGSDRDVADPWYTRDFELTYRDILLGCTALFRSVVEKRKA